MLFKGFARKGTLALSSIVLALSLAACGTQTESQPNQGAAPSDGKTAPAPEGLKGEIKIDGSSTVFPISQAVAEEFMKKHKDVKITVGESGSSNGVKKLLAGEIHIADMSKKFKPEELEELKAKQNTEAVEMPIALDGVTVVVNKKNTFAKEMTVEELKKIWSKDSQVKKWSDVRPEWPDKEIKLYGPGTASGTFEFFTEAINGKAKESRSDYTPSEDDNVLVKGVQGDEFAMGYFGFSYYKANEATLNAVAIKKDANSPAVAPTKETIEKMTYAPLSRYLYVYPTKKAIAEPHIKEFLKYYNSEEGAKMVEAVDYIRLPQDVINKNLEALK
ncbi:PstS family phosphate ABC transporter substrate-binding protein [Paenibacillus sp. JMULE4]|uniref:PstS family phosphate ABC transporter substrate-binding protein n=1 Tax=Paenibacillus TaxID=44249 RepID=UPI00088CAA63|nr:MULTISPECIES: PstS family phosphate ABC transporter substrate-binding protein [Paenibacillus]NTZ18912.1 PstS family phosphate ABC transporter substrate-binding protein [Paenibacillus sp. JMULE4]SDI19068.1 phosphate transport system substrate-binding protein [Paenibacillus naphthalenovorans]